MCILVITNFMQVYIDCSRIHLLILFLIVIHMLSLTHLYSKPRHYQKSTFHNSRFMITLTKIHPYNSYHFMFYLVCIFSFDNTFFTLKDCFPNVQIIVLENGKVIEQGPHEVLLSKAGRYAQLWGQQNNSVDAVDTAIKLGA